MIEKLLAALADGTDSADGSVPSTGIGAEEIADILWLAARVDPAGTRPPDEPGADPPGGRPPPLDPLHPSPAPRPGRTSRPAANRPSSSSRPPGASSPENRPTRPRNAGAHPCDCPAPPPSTTRSP